MRDLALLATDFDGTLIGEPEAPRDLYLSFRQQLRQMRLPGGTHWAIVTGRHMDLVASMSSELLMHGLAPDFFVMEDACIFHRRGGRYWPFFFWNLGIRGRRRQQLRRYRPMVSALIRETAWHYPEAKNMAGNRLIDFWFDFREVAEAVAVEQRLLTEFATNPDFFIFRWGTEVCLAPTAGTKGEAVKKLMSVLNAPPERVLAIGDGQNDISMLDGRSAGLVACVGNATDTVKETVKRAAGFVAAGHHLHGVMEILANSWPDNAPGA